MSASLLFPFVPFIRLPKMGKARQQWIDIIKRHQDFTDVDQNTQYYSVCSLHFIPAMILPHGNSTRLREEAYPTQFPDKHAVANDNIFADTRVAPVQIDTDPLESQEELCSGSTWYGVRMKIVCF